MHLIRTALLTAACITLAAPAAASAATLPHSPAYSRLVIYGEAATGDGTTQEGPPGPLTADWVPWTEPTEIAIFKSKDDKDPVAFLEETPDVKPTDTHRWSYNLNQVVLQNFKWLQSGIPTVVGTNLASFDTTPNLDYFDAENGFPGVGTGVRAARCMAFTVTGYGTQYVQLTKPGGKWVISDSTACATAP